MHPTSFPLLVSLTLIAWAPSPATAGKPIPAQPARPVVGTSQAYTLLPDLETATWEAGRGRWSEVVEVPGASFLKLHLSAVNLRRGDTLTLRNANGRVVETITGRGPKDATSFWTLSAFGSRLNLELTFTHRYPKPPFEVDRLITGHDDAFGATKSLCAQPDFEDVVCYQDDAAKWANIRATAGVMTVGGDPATALFCSATNVSPRNMVLTNQHCIENQAECDNAEFIFRYRNTGCDDGSGPDLDAWVSFRCDEVMAQSPFVNCDAGLDDLDFTLASVYGGGNLSTFFGFANPDPSPLADGEAIYIVQHPDGRPQEITHGSGADVEVDGTVLRYYGTLDTEGGSSGSPIFRDSDDALIGLHHCGGCTTPGVGNRGMLMADIHPHIAPFLCTTEASLEPAGGSDLEEQVGNGDAALDPGETWRFMALLRNVSCTTEIRDVTATVALGPGSDGPANLLDTLTVFSNLDVGQIGDSVAPIYFTLGRTFPCGGTVDFDLVNLTASNSGPFDDLPAVFSAQAGAVLTTNLMNEGFTGGLPPGWTVVDGGDGSGAAATWTTTNPGNRNLGLTPPFAIVDSDVHGTGQMDEALITPPLTVPAASRVGLNFRHHFNWYSGGQDEQADVDVRSTATGGTWVNVRNFSGADASGIMQIDVTAMAAGQSDFQVRFRYHQASFEWWWAVDDITLLVDDGFTCQVFLDILFADGFESGDTGTWSVVVP